MIEKTESMQSDDQGAGLAPLVSLLVAWMLIVAASLIAYAPVKPASRSVDASSFSAVRAQPILEKLVGDGIPHPAGSEQNRIVRQRIVDLLKSWGYEVEIQSGRDSRKIRRPGDRDSEPLELHNLIAIKRGARPSSEIPALMLVAHYDSVPAGPGACDDGVGTAAVLEIARMLSAEPQFQRDIIFLITDGEEYGLLGAKLFAEDHPLADEVGLMMNVEARGTTGPSIMFETSHHSRHLIPLFAQSVRKPLASSLFFEIYRRMPNDTDFSVLRKNGTLGFNLAFIGEVRNYHTPQDNIENVDFGSFQHHGENMLGILRTALRTEPFLEFLDAHPRHAESTRVDSRNEAVYFDFFGLAVIWWPMSWTPAIVCVIAGLGLLSAARLWSKRNKDLEPQTATGWLVQMALILLCFAASAAALWGILQLIQLHPDTASPWPRQPFPIGLGLWLSGLAVTGWMSWLLHRFLFPVATWVASILIGLVLSAVCAGFITGASYLFIVPLAITGVVSLPISLIAGTDSPVYGWLLAVSAGLFWLPLDRMFYDAVGFGLWPLLVGRIALVSTVALCVLAASKRRAKSTFAMLATAGATGSLIVAALLNMNG